MPDTRRSLQWNGQQFRHCSFTEQRRRRRRRRSVLCSLSDAQRWSAFLEAGLRHPPVRQQKYISWRRPQDAERFFFSDASSQMSSRSFWHADSDLTLVARVVLNECVLICGRSNLVCFNHGRRSGSRRQLDTMEGNVGSAGRRERTGGEGQREGDGQKGADGLGLA